MRKHGNDHPVPCSKLRGSLTTEEARHWLGKLREARAIALADAEGFDAVLFAMEALGQFVCGESGRGLADYEPAFRWLMYQSEATKSGDCCENLRFEAVFPMVRRIRNDAMHQGAIARNATVLCVELALMLEEGLLANATTVGDYMITAPVEAKLFESLGEIRRTMLMHSFSYLPVRDRNKNWKLVSDQALAKHLQGRSNSDRTRRLAQSLEDSGLLLLDANRVGSDVSVSEVLDQLDSRPVLVVREVNGCIELVGLVTAFDLL